MRLLKITLKNFLGTKDQTYEFPNGCNATFYGRNGTGKTTIYSAYTWLIFGKVEDTTNFSPKTIVNEDCAHNLEHGVEGVFKDEDGRVITFKKIFKEVYKKKRGSATAEFSGHNTEHYIDGVPIREKEYMTAIENHFGDIEKVKLLTMPKFFAEALKWEERRKLLLEVCGDISDRDIIDSDPKLEELPGFLLIEGTDDKLHTIDEYKKIAGKKRADINKQLDFIPARIDEAEKAIPDTAGLNKNAIETKIKSLELEREKLFEEKASVSATTDANARKYIAELQAKLADKKAVYYGNINKANEAINAAVAAEQDKLAEISQVLIKINNDITNKEWGKKNFEEERAKLLEEYNSLFTTKWDSNKEVCEFCGQRLPRDTISELKTMFHAKRSEKLSEINKKGMSAKEAIEKLETELEKLRTEKEAELAKKEECKENISKLTAKRVAADFEETAEFKEFSGAIAKAEKELENGKILIANTYRDINIKLNDVEMGIKTEQDKLAKITYAENQKERIQALEKQEEELAAEYEHLEKGIYLCDEFVKTKVAALNDRINNKFKTIKFRLFTEQINGGVKEGCEILVKSKTGAMVPYSSTNTTVNSGAKPIAGLEVISVLSDYWGLKLPVFVDNAESITEPFSVDTQIIKLYASKDDDILRLEVSE